LNILKILNQTLILKKDFESDSDFEESITVDYEDVDYEEPEQSIELGESTIEDISESEVEVEFFNDESSTGEYFSISSDDLTVTGDENNNLLKKKAIAKLHQAWLKVNNLKNLNPDEPRVVALESELNEAVKGDFDAKDVIVLADESLEEAEKLEKEFQELIHVQVDSIYHIVHSKLILAKKIGFEVMELETKLDEISSIIAEGDYLKARNNLDLCLEEISALPKKQDEIMIGLDEQSDLIQELLEPLPEKRT
jgi:hypothetical protein